MVGLLNASLGDIFGRHLWAAQGARGLCGEAYLGLYWQK